jgi:hypothetical protein
MSSILDATDFSVFLPLSIPNTIVQSASVYKEEAFHYSIVDAYAGICLYPASLKRYKDRRCDL